MYFHVSVSVTFLFIMFNASVLGDVAAVIVHQTLFLDFKETWEVGDHLAGG